MINDNVFLILLPSEVFLCIARFLDTTSLCLLCSTCTTIYSLLDDEVFWKERNLEYTHKHLGLIDKTRHQLLLSPYFSWKWQYIVGSPNLVDKALKARDKIEIYLSDSNPFFNNSLSSSLLKKLDLSNLGWDFPRMKLFQGQFVNYLTVLHNNESKKYIHDWNSLPVKKLM